MKKRIMISILLACMLVNLVACAADNVERDAPTDLQADVRHEEALELGDEESLDQEDSSDKDDVDEDDLQLITVTYEIDTMLFQAIVHITNGSERTFSGSVHIRFYVGNKMVGFDSIFVEDLNPGNTTWAKIAIDAISDVTMDYLFNEVEFTDFVNKENFSLDESASAQLTDDMDTSFGDPEWGASWYDRIDRYEVYTDGAESYAIVIVTTDDADTISSIAYAVFANYGEKYSLNQVLIKNTDGDTLFTRSK